MKKILVLLTIFSMVFTSCEPLEMINAESDAIPNPIVGDAEYTLTADDYDDVRIKLRELWFRRCSKICYSTIFS